MMKILELVNIPELRYAFFSSSTDEGLLPAISSTPTVIEIAGRFSTEQIEKAITDEPPYGEDGLANLLYLYALIIAISKHDLTVANKYLDACVDAELPRARGIKRVLQNTKDTTTTTEVAFSSTLSDYTLIPAETFVMNINFHKVLN
ncbi:hypothetical protein QUF72_12500 [Desulfobacterales bacterium HSG2]|nr:hypothetical protein [Desulfobacterales bacterium HSG2]